MSTTWEAEAAAIAALEPKHVLFLCVANMRDELERRLTQVFATRYE